MTRHNINDSIKIISLIEQNNSTNHNTIFNNQGDVSYYNNASQTTAPMETIEQNFFDKEALFKKGIRSTFYSFTFILAALIPFWIKFATPEIQWHFINIEINIPSIHISKWLPILFGILFLINYIWGYTLRKLWSEFSSSKKTQTIIGKRFYSQQENKICEEVKKGNCIYLNCKGEVSLAIPPEREKANHKVIGICSIDPYLHTYSIDQNGIMTKCAMDRRPIDHK